jgi:hypothetical protein
VPCALSCCVLCAHQGLLFLCCLCLWCLEELDKYWEHVVAAACSGGEVGVGGVQVGRGGLREKGDLKPRPVAGAAVRACFGQCTGGVGWGGEPHAPAAQPVPESSARQPAAERAQPASQPAALRSLPSLAHTCGAVAETFLALLGEPSVEVRRPLALSRPEPVAEVAKLVRELRSIRMHSRPLTVQHPQRAAAQHPQRTAVHCARSLGE